MSKEYTKKVEALDGAKEMDDVVALFAKITEAYPNAILYCSNIATTAAQGMTLVSADTDKTKVFMKDNFGLESAHDQQSLTKVMLIAMIESACREQGIETKDFFKDAKFALQRAKNAGVI